jgi:hypothetical protein
VQATHHQRHHRFHSKQRGFEIQFPSLSLLFTIRDQFSNFEERILSSLVIDPLSKQFPSHDIDQKQFSLHFYHRNSTTLSRMHERARLHSRRSPAFFVLLERDERKENYFSFAMQL